MLLATGVAVDNHAAVLAPVEAHRVARLQVQIEGPL
jgi:hypothetical protein